MPRVQGSSAYFEPAPKVARPEVPLTGVQEAASRRHLWDVALAANAYLRRSTMGRLDAEATRRAGEELERALQRLPAEGFA